MTKRSAPARSIAALCGAAALGLAVSTAAPARAEAVKEQVTFDLVLRGITAGTLSFSGVQDGAGYAVVGRLSTGGLVAMLRKVSYDATARGTVAKGRYTPSSYREKADTGRRQSEAEMRYKGGVPQVMAYSPPREPRPTDVDPATQAGTVDPLTALYATLRDVDPGKECNIDLRMFDGRRSSRLIVAAPKAEGDRVRCAGEYRRVGGFSDKEMAEKVRFPFTLTYAPTADGRMRVVEVAMDSLYGRARLTRRAP